MRTGWVLGVAGCALIAGQATAQTVDLAQAFGARPGVRSGSLSPDGTKIALIASGAGQSDQLFVVDVAAGSTPKRILTATGKPERLDRCEWVANTRLACRVWGQQYYDDQVYGFSTNVALDADGSNQRVISKRQGENALYSDWRGGGIIDLLPQEDGAVLMMRSYVPESNVNSLIENRSQGMGVDRIDTRSGQAKRVEPARADAVEYITDGQGNVRIMGNSVSAASGYAKGVTRYLYRSDTKGGWRPLSDYDWVNRTGFNPYAVDAERNVAYGFERLDGRLALYSVALDGSGQRQLLLDSKEVDVDSLVTIGRNRRVVGASFEADKRVNVYFDPTIKTMASALSKALGGKAAYVVDSSANENWLLLWAGSDTDPGQYYLYDKAAKKLSPVLPERPQLAGVKLAEVRPMFYPATDGTRIPAYLTLPPGSSGKELPAIVMPHGGPEARDYWGFDWLAQYFAARGFAVIQPNFRGSAGYGIGWLQDNGFKSWRTSVGDVADAGRYLVAQGIADPQRLTVLGWSYGGYAALQSAVLTPGLFKAVVAVAPATDLGTLVENARYTSGYYLQKRYIGTGPHLEQGSPAQNVSAFTVPVLMFHGTIDMNVPIKQARLMDDRLRGAGKASELVVFEGLDHQLDDGAARARLLKQAGDFLERAGK